VEACHHIRNPAAQDQNIRVEQMQQADHPQAKDIPSLFNDL
jgi:hypothetical protein